MAKWWIAPALLALGLAQAAPVRAQAPPAGDGVGGLYQPAFADNPTPVKGPEFCPEEECPAPKAIPYEQRNEDGNAFGGGPNEAGCINHYQFHFEYLLWRLRGDLYPPLVTTGDAADPIPGALGQPGTTVVFGDERVGVGTFSGARLGLSYWSGEYQDIGFDASFFALEQRTAFTTFSSDGSTGTASIARPFFNINAGTEDADPVALTDVQAGTLDVRVMTRLLGAEADVRFNMTGNSYDSGGLTFLSGFRYLNLDDTLFTPTSITDLPLGTGNSFYFADNFATHNRFYGGQIGCNMRVWWERLTFDVAGKVALGATQETVRISGITSIAEPDGTVTKAFDRAVYVQPSNNGRYTRSKFSYVPEGSATLGLQVAEQLRLSIGYTFLYWSNVVRPGQAIDRTLNIQPVGTTEQLGPLRPAFSFHDNFLFVHGLNAGFEFSF